MEITTVVNSSESHPALKEMNHNYMHQYVNVQTQSAYMILRILITFILNYIYIKKLITEKYTQYDFICIKFKTIKPYICVKHNTFKKKKSK